MLVLLTFDTPSEQTKPTVTLFLLLLKYAHISVIMTCLACRAMAHMPVHSPLSLRSRGGSQFLPWWGDGYFLEPHIHLILFLKACSVFDLLTTLLSFDQRTGPKYLMLNEKFIIICKKELCSLNRRNELASSCPTETDMCFGTLE